MKTTVTTSMFFSILTQKKTSLALLVFALLIGGVSVQAAGVLNTSSGGYLVCVNSKTKVVTHPGTSTCPKGKKKLILGAKGADGIDGLIGAAGIAGKDGTNGKDGKTLWNGVKDPESTWGAPGDMFINTTTKTLFGPKNLDGSWPAGVSMVGPAGATGVAGPAGATGPAGAAGSSGIAITQLSICGTSGTSLCKVGEKGPGGGTIFFVDYNDLYAGFNYLEAAPKSCESQTAWSSDATHSLLSVNGWAARAVGSGQTNTTAMLKIGATSYTGDLSGAAFYSAALASGVPAGCVTSKDDWFLGSLGEMKLMYDNLQGVGGFVEGFYWSSTEYATNYAWGQYFYDGYQLYNNKTNTFYVRPVRAFL